MNRLLIILVAMILQVVICVGCGNKEQRQHEDAPAPVAAVNIPIPNEHHATKTRVVLLGTGTPIPDENRSGPSVAVISGGRSYIVDFGPGVVRRAQAAFRQGITELAMENLSIAFATHLHSDHTLGLPDLLLTPPVVGRRSPLFLWGPKGIKKMTEDILSAYEIDLNIRSQGHNPEDMSGYNGKVFEIDAFTLPAVVYKNNEMKVTAFSVDHGVVENAFAYRFDAKDRSIVISGDTSPTETIVNACNGCDVLVHEVYCSNNFSEGGDSWQKYHSEHHTSGKELAAIATKAKPGILVLYHLLFFGCDETQLLNEVKAGYSGEVILGTDLDVI